LRGRDHDFTLAETLDLLDDIDKAAANRDWREVCRLGRILPLDSEVAKQLKTVMGKETLAKLGFDLTEANLRLGKGWLHERD
jgi:hypothetical protein